MKEMVQPGSEKCPFVFNLDAKTFKPGDQVCYHVTGSLAEMPFVGVLLEVHDDYVILAHDDGNRPPKSTPVRGTRTDRPIVQEEDALR